MAKITKDLINISKDFSKAVDKLSFEKPVFFVYNPLDYAFSGFEKYIQKYASKKEVVFLGMNPGPFGMAQTGIPFGEIDSVKNWMKIETKINQPKSTHPKRPIEGFECKKSEVSGKRLWGGFAEWFGDSESFFANNFVLNYCPLVFVSETGSNITPDKLQKEERENLFNICDEYLLKTINALDPKWCIGVGKFARKRLEMVISGRKIDDILHPSPASPHANRGWAPQAKKKIDEIGIWG